VILPIWSFLDSSCKGVKKPCVNQQKSGLKGSTIQGISSGSVPLPGLGEWRGGGVSAERTQQGWSLLEVVKAFREKDAELPGIPENPYRQIAGESIIVL